MLYIDPIHSTRCSWGSYYRGNESATMLAGYLLLGSSHNLPLCCFKPCSLLIEAMICHATASLSSSLPQTESLTFPLNPSVEHG